MLNIMISSRPETGERCGIHIVSLTNQGTRNVLQSLFDLQRDKAIKVTQLWNALQEFIAVSIKAGYKGKLSTAGCEFHSDGRVER